MKRSKQNKVIALTGPAGIGKTSIANVLRDDYNYEVLSFATELRKMAAERYKVPFELFEIVSKDQNYKNRPFEFLDDKTPRQVLIEMGAEFRQQNPDFWVEAIKPAVYHAFSEYKDVVIDDCRYINEARFITEDLDGIVIFLTSPQKGHLKDCELLESKDKRAVYYRTHCDTYDMPFSVGMETACRRAAAAFDARANALNLVKSKGLEDTIDTEETKGD